MTKTGGNTFQESINSGTANINIAGEGRGVIASGSLKCPMWIYPKNLLK
ncbi:hypothetical protein Q5O89_14835 [Peribacillus frigoritolerans]|nr:hypothetical protein [Peribacillus frigoritolerans]